MKICQYLGIYSVSINKYVKKLILKEVLKTVKVINDLPSSNLENEERGLMNHLLAAQKSL